MYKNIIIWILILFFPGIRLQSQEFTNSKKAFKEYTEAEKALNTGRLSDAEAHLLIAIKKDNAFIEAYNLLGDVYYYSRKPELSREYYLKAIQINPDKYPIIYFALANTEFSMSKYEEAKVNYKKYLQKNEARKLPLTESMQKKINKSLKDCDFAIQAMKNPVSYNPKNLGDSINTKFHEYFPSLSVDGKTLLFTRLIESKGSANNAGKNEDFYTAQSYTDGKNEFWRKAVNIGPPINTPYNEGAPCLSPDGMVLFFTACETYGSYGDDRKGLGSCDLFYSNREGEYWSSPVNTGKPINSNKWESQPSFSSDGKTIYFLKGSTDKRGNKSQYIYTSELTDKGIWKEPVKLNNKINVPGYTQQSVFIHPDNRTLYYSSDGPAGMGGLDIFMSRRDSTGDWGEPVNLGFPINTVKDEDSFVVSGDGKTAYFASDRKDGRGGLDLYAFELPENYRPVIVSHMKGKVYDKITGQPLLANFQLINIETGKIEVQSFSNKLTGEFLVSLPADKNYALNVNAEGYLFYSQNFTMKTASVVEPFTKNIPLNPIKEGETVVLKNIFFETASWEIKQESQTELNKLVELLIKNPGMKIEISGHTDNIGEEEYNLALSENRAKSVFDYLVSRNINTERVKYKGYGETKPIDTNDTEEGKANNRRTEFRVLSVN